MVIAARALNERERLGLRRGHKETPIAKNSDMRR